MSTTCFSTERLEQYVNKLIEEIRVYGEMEISGMKNNNKTLNKQIYFIAIIVIVFLIFAFNEGKIMGKLLSVYID